MTETGTRPQDLESDIPGDDCGRSATSIAPLPCPFGRHLSYATWEYSIQIGYADLTGILDQIEALWDHLEDTGTMDNPAGDMLEGLLDHIREMREWTGWGGVPGEFTQ
jgi:hypothetical protein